MTVHTSKGLGYDNVIVLNGRNETYGLRLYICTNEPEVCSFMTSNLRGKKLSIMKCPDCQVGYLLVKTSNNGGECFLGCSNYKVNRQGCNKTISMREYYKMMGYDLSEINQNVHGNSIQNKQNNNKSNQDVSHRVIKESIKSKQVPFENWEKDTMEDSILEIVGSVLQCLVTISDKKFYNDTILIRTLYGSSDQRILKNKLDLSPEYGQLSYLERQSIRKVVDWLIDNHYIIKTKGAYPVLHITNEGIHYKEHMTPENMKSLIELLNGEIKEGKKQKESNAGASWSREEDDKLVQEFSFGMSISQIANEHKRSYGAIRARLIKHGLIERV